MSEPDTVDPLTAIKAYCAAIPTLADIPDPIPESENPNALFCNGWLRKGGGAFLIAPTGQGKSTWTIQAALCWAQGKEAFGIKPVKPLKIAIIQSEDDKDELAQFRNDIVGGLLNDKTFGVDADSVKEASTRILLPEITGVIGKDFADRISWLLENHKDIDLLIVNPFKAYFGSDTLSNADVTEFLRCHIDPVIKGHPVGILFVHHTNKPPKPKERKDWDIDVFSQYIGSGAAELADWPRAILVLMPCEQTRGLYRLVASKRGNRLGWIDAAGEKTTVRFIAHSTGRIFWRNATPEEIAALSKKNKEKGKRDECDGEDEVKRAEKLAEYARAKPQKSTDLRDYACAIFERTRGRSAYDYLREHASDFGLLVVPAKRKNAAFIGLPKETAEAALKWDTDKPKG